MNNHKESMRYRIVEEGGSWLIESAADPELTWSGRCWSSANWGGSPLTFADEAAAQKYAEEVWGCPETLTTHTRHKETP